MGRRKGFHLNKKNILEKKIPFPISVRRKVVLEFKTVCGELGLGVSPMAEELILQFILDYRRSIREGLKKNN